MKSTDKKTLQAAYAKLVDEYNSTMAELYPDNEHIDTKKTELTNLRLQFDICKEKIDDLEKALQFYQKDDKVQRMVDFVQFAPFITFKSDVILYRAKQFLLINAGEYSGEVESSNYTYLRDKKFRSNLLKGYALPWCLLDKTEPNEIFHLNMQGKSKGFHSKYIPDIRNRLKLSTNIPTDKSFYNYSDYSMYYSWHDCYSFDTNASDYPKNVSLLLKAHFNFSAQVKELGNGTYDALSAAEYLVGLLDDGFVIEDDEMLQTAQAYLKKESLLQSQKELEEKLWGDKPPKPLKSKVSVGTNSRANQIAFLNPGSIAFFDIAQECVTKIQDAIEQLRVHALQQQTEQENLLHEVNALTKQLSMGHLSPSNKEKVIAAVHRFKDCLKIHPDDSINKLIAIQKEIDIILLNINNISFGNRGLDDLYNIMHTKSTIFENLSEFIDNTCDTYINRIDFIIDSKAEIVVLLSELLAMFTRFDDTRECERKELTDHAAKAKVAAAIQQKAVTQYFNLLDEMALSSLELLPLAVSGVIETDKALLVLKELKKFEGSLKSALKKKILSVSMQISDFPKVMASVTHTLHKELQQALYAIKYNV